MKTGSIQKGIKYIVNPDYRFALEAFQGRHRDVEDEEYLKRMYHGLTGKRLRLEHPVTFNEKLQWLKLYDRRPVYTTMADKYAAKQYIADRIGADYVIPTLGIWDRAEDIDFDALPSQFVLKTTHDSGSVVICRDKRTFDVKGAAETLNKSLNRDYYSLFREWPYKDIKRRILAEEFLDAGEEKVPNDYKVLCFNGVPKTISVHTGRFTNHRAYFFSPDWKPMEIAFPPYVPDQSIEIKQPEHLQEMLRLARTLSNGIAFLRTDFYEVDGRLYMGELTFFPASGFKKFVPPQSDETLGSWLTLS